MDLVKRDFDEYKINAEVENLWQELGVCVDDCRMLRWSSSSFARVLQNLSLSEAERDGWCWRCHFRSICLLDLECWSSCRLRCERQDVSEVDWRSSCRRSRLNRPLTTQEITDCKDQLYNRAVTQDSKGNEQPVLVLVSVRITAERRSISS